MRVLLVHNRYQQAGGEDIVFEAEAQLLERHGHAVTRLACDNHVINARRSPWSNAQLAVSTVWSRRGSGTVRDAIRLARPDVVHFHNTFPLISPAAYGACKREGVAVVQTLHNYRLLCPAATFYRDGQVCEDCLGKAFPWPSLAHSCYRCSRTQTGTVATMIGVHRALRTWKHKVDCYVALSEFGRNKFVEGGLPAERIVVKPNFVDPDPGIGTGRGGYALFVGRLAAEKGVGTLLSAWNHVAEEVPLRIAGDGPLAPDVAAAAAQDTRIQWLGHQPSQEITRLMADASLLVFPSEWYEGLSRTLLEALAAGTPIVGTNLGSMRDVIHDDETGFRFTPGDAAQLAATINRVWSNPTRLASMRQSARRMFESTYTSAENYKHLTQIYDRAISQSGGQPWPRIETSDRLGSHS